MVTCELPGSACQTVQVPTFRGVTDKEGMRSLSLSLLPCVHGFPAQASLDLSEHIQHSAVCGFRCSHLQARHVVRGLLTLKQLMHESTTQPNKITTC